MSRDSNELVRVSSHITRSTHLTYYLIVFYDLQQREKKHEKRHHAEQIDNAIVRKLDQKEKHTESAKPVDFPEKRGQMRIIKKKVQLSA